MKVSLLIPIYNERGSLDALFAELRKVWRSLGGADALPASRDGAAPGPENAAAQAPNLDDDAPEIVLIDDGSTDGTSEELSRAPLPPGWKLVRHEHNRGYGAALRTGLRVSRHPLAAIADADGTYPLARIAEWARELERREELSMIVGARTTPSARKAIPAARRPAKWLLTRLAERLAERPIPDLNSGLRVFRRRDVDPFLPLTPNGFSFTTTITLALLTNGFEVRWEPIEYFPREGRSKIRPVRDTLGFLQLILRTLLYFNPLKFFLPASLFFLAAGFGLLVARLLSPHPFGLATTITFFLTGFQFLAIGLLADLIDKRLR